jgi:hypothetical protein
MSDPKASSNDLSPEELDKVAGGGGHFEVEGGHGSLTDGGHGSLTDGGHNLTQGGGGHGFTK